MNSSTKPIVKKSLLAPTLAVMTALLGSIGCSSGVAPGKPDGGTQPTVLVDTAKIRYGLISESIKVYGRIEPEPGQVQIVSVPFESIVRSVVVSEGQLVQKGEPLVVVTRSKAASFQLEQAGTQLEAARKSLKATRERLNLQLATAEDLTIAQEHFAIAKQQMTSLSETKSGGAGVLRALTNGITWKILAEPGAVFPAGQPLINFVPEGETSVHVGVELENIDRLQMGATAALQLIGAAGAKAVSGTVNMISRQVNPGTGLVDVWIQLPSISPGFDFLNRVVSASIDLTSTTGLLVPQQAVLPEDGGFVVLTVNDGKAVAHQVTIGLENDQEIQVFSDSLSRETRVIISGNYELREGDLVREYERKTK